MERFYEEKELDGALHYRTSQGGAFRKKLAKTPIDHLLEIAQVCLNTKTSKATLLTLGIDAGTVTRIRKGEMQPSAKIVLRFYDVTGLSIETIRSIFNLAPLV